MGIWDSLTGKTSSETSNAAARDTYKKQQGAIDDIRSYGNRYAGEYRDLATGYDPYVSAGGSALNQLMAGLGLGGDQAGFTDAYRGLPGYQSGLQTGQNSALAAANAGGRLNSGATQKALARYGSDYEDQRVGSYLDRLTGLSGMGQQATGQQIATVGQGLQGQLGTRQSAFQGDMQSAGTIGQGMVAGAQAEQQGLTNLLGAASSIGGQFLGMAGGAGGGGGMSSFTNLFKPNTGWSNGTPQGRGLGGYGGSW